MHAVIFDMDGTLIDSEPLWKEAEHHVFSSVGVKLSSELTDLTATMTTREVTEFWYRHSPWSEKSLETVENEVINHVESLIAERGAAMAGVKEILEFFQQKGFKIGLATNSPAKLIDEVLNTLNISHYFHEISSSEHESKGKPDPAVYLSTAKKLNVSPSNCIAFEDSISGLIAAQQANIKTVAVPPTENFSDKSFDAFDLKIRTLSEFSDTHLDQLKLPQCRQTIA